MNADDDGADDESGALLMPRGTAREMRDACDAFWVRRGHVKKTQAEIRTWLFEKRWKKKALVTPPVSHG